MCEQIVLSLDMSTTCTGWALFKEEKLIDYGKITPNKNDEWQDRLQETAFEIKSVVEHYNPTKIIAEDVPLKRSGGMKTLVMLGAVQGALLAICGTYDIEYQLVPVATWRRKVELFDGTEKGKERSVLKQHSIELANKLFDLSLVYKSPTSKFNDDDISDAILVGYSTFLKDKRLVRKINI